MSVTHLAVIAVALLLSIESSAASTDLLAAWQAARANDPVFLSARAEAIAGTHRREEARALWRPSVSIQAGAGYTDMRSDTEGAAFSAPGMGSFDQARFTTELHSASDTYGSLVLTQPIYDRARSSTARQLDLQDDLGQARERQAESTLLVRVAQSYADVLVAEDALQSIRAYKKAVGETLDIARERFRVGKSASVDMREAQADYDNVCAEEIAARNELVLRQGQFADLTGLPSTDLIPLSSKADLQALRRADLASLTQTAIQNNPGVTVGILGKQIAAREADRARAANSPRLDMVARYDSQRIDGSNADGNASLDTHRGWVGLQLTVPLYTGGLTSARTQAALALADRADRQTEAARITVTQEVRNAFLALNTSLGQIQALGKAVDSAQERADATRTGQEVGARTTADVLFAERALQAARHRLLTARYSAFVQSIRLQTVMNRENGNNWLRSMNALLGH